MTLDIINMTEEDGKLLHEHICEKAYEIIDSYLPMDGGIIYTKSDLQRLYTLGYYQACDDLL